MVNLILIYNTALTENKIGMKKSSFDKAMSPCTTTGNEKVITFLTI
jgi:hypothetical protein